MQNSLIRLSYCLLAIAFLSCSKKETVSSNITNVIPIPQQVDSGSGHFEWNNQSSIVLPTNTEWSKCALYLQQVLTQTTGNNVEINESAENRPNAIVLSLDASIVSNEAYVLDVNKNNITIKASHPAGIFYGIQTLLQLMPPEVMQAGGLKNGFAIEAVHITDSPRFAYRGMHLDVSRNFMNKDEVKNYIDLLAMYKFNRFHWHLTDGSGWRIEIKKYPLLTQKAAFRKEPIWKEFWRGDRQFVDEGTPDAYGGYYTQEDIKEVVAYAADRFITIIPEIEMPGHSEEVFVAYPELSCSGKPYKNGDFCAGNEATFNFLEDVLSEVMELFPSEYIHIGGDEAGKSAWKTCPKCQKRIKDEKLADVNELQSYFVKRVSNYLHSKGRKLIGWDEIAEGGLAADATVMLWRDPKVAVEAAKHGHKVIMTPGSHCYFDAYQSDPTTEPEAIGGYLTLRKVYSFEVVPNDSLAEYFIGGQANIWTEYIPNYKHVQYMAFPRAIALSEALWSGKELRDWNSFKKRLPNQLKRLEYMDVNFHRPSYELETFEKVDHKNKRVAIYFDSEQYQPLIRYTTDGSMPTETSDIYEDTIYADRPIILTASIFEDGKAMKPIIRKSGYNLSTGKKVTYLKKWTSYAAGGETALTDGLIGGLSYSDKLWQGFTSDLDVVIDFESEVSLSSFDARFMQLTGPGVYMPEYVTVSTSADGETFEEVLNIKNDIPRSADRLCFKDFSGSFDGKSARYVKVFAKNGGGFIFTDEIIIN